MSRKLISSTRESGIRSWSSSESKITTKSRGGERIEQRLKSSES
jgi:hypothetical protein